MVMPIPRLHVFSQGVNVDVGKFSSPVSQVWGHVPMETLV